jgi:hypothetical protein
MVQAIFLGVVAFSTSPAGPREFEHEAKRFEVTHGNGRVHQRTEVRVFDAKSKKTIWFRRFDGWTSIAWDRGNRSIAIAEPMHVTIWRSGHKIVRFRLPNLKETPGHGAYAGGVSWSPDSGHILLRIPAELGDSERNIGRLVVMDAKSGQSWVIAEQVVMASWVSSTLLSLRQIDESAAPKPSEIEPYLSEPRFWSTEQKAWFRVSEASSRE